LPSGSYDNNDEKRVRWGPFSVPEWLADRIEAIIKSEQTRAQQEKRDVPKRSQVVVHIVRLGVEAYTEKEGEKGRRP